jgi:hypothetical protein
MKGHGNGQVINFLINKFLFIKNTFFSKCYFLAVLPHCGVIFPFEFHISCGIQYKSASSKKKWIFQKIEIAIILIIFQIFTLDGRFVSSLDGFKSTLSMNEIKDGTILYLVDGRSNIIQKLEFM